MRKRFLQLGTTIAVFLLIFIFQGNKDLNKSKEEVLSTENTARVFIADFTVTKVIDGDTIEVVIKGVKTKIRVIGINTPETVDPRKDVECFGKEASDKAKSILLNKIVRLEEDMTQNNIDKYGRLLRYIFTQDKNDFGLEMIREGFAYEYTYADPYKYQASYIEAQKSAQSNLKGLWGDTNCSSEL